MNHVLINPLDERSRKVKSIWQWVSDSDSVTVTQCQCQWQTVTVSVTVSEWLVTASVSDCVSLKLTITQGRLWPFVTVTATPRCIHALQPPVATTRPLTLTLSQLALNVPVPACFCLLLSGAGSMRIKHSLTHLRQCNNQLDYIIFIYMKFHSKLWLCLVSRDNISAKLVIH